MTTTPTNPGSAAPSQAAPASSAPASQTPAQASPVPKSTLDDVTSAPEAERPSWVTDDVQNAMNFDPFTPAGDEVEVPSPEGQQAPGEGTQAQPPSQTPAVPPGGTPAPAGTQPAPISPEIQAILDQNRALVEQVSQLTAGQKPGGQPQEQPPQDVFAQMPEYIYELPDPLMVSLNSEDPVERKRAMTHLIRGVAQGIHKTVLGVVAQRLTQLETAIPSNIQQRMAHAETARTVHTDFYGKFPQLNNPVLLPVVKQIAEAHMKETGQTHWSPELRDAIGQKVLQVLAGVVPAAAPAAPKPAAAPAMFGGNAPQGRPAPKTGPKTQQDHMADIF